MVVVVVVSSIECRGPPGPGPERSLGNLGLSRSGWGRHGGSTLAATSAVEQDTLVEEEDCAALLLAGLDESWDPYCLGTVLRTVYKTGPRAPGSPAPLLLGCRQCLQVSAVT